MQMLFFDMQGMILKHWVHHKKTVNGECYSEIQKTAPWNTVQKIVFLTSRKCKATFCTVVVSVFANFSGTPVKCLPYSPNFTYCDFYVFPTL